MTALERLAWIDPDGRAWDLTGDIGAPTGALVTEWGLTGTGGPERTLITKALPAGGVLVTHLTVQAGKLAIPLLITHPTQAGFYQLREGLRFALNPWRTGRRAPGVLTWTRGDGTSRQVEAFCTAFPEDRSPDASGPTWQATVLEFLLPDPYWSDATPQRFEFVPPPVKSFYVPYPTLTDGRVRGDVQILNDGQVDAYPRWTFTGPASSITVANTTTGEAFAYDEHLAAGEQVIVETRRGAQSVRRASDGANRMAALDWPGATLWALHPGTNHVQLQMNGSGPGTNTMVEFLRRYEGP